MLNSSCSVFAGTPGAISAVFAASRRSQPVTRMLFGFSPCTDNSAFAPVGATAAESHALSTLTNDSTGTPSATGVVLKPDKQGPSRRRR